MAAVGCPKMMSSLLFYHKKENPSLASLTVRGVVGSSGSARSGPEGLLLRVNLANLLSYAPRPRRKGKSRGRGAEGGDANLPCPPFFLWGSFSFSSL